MQIIQQAQAGCLAPNKGETPLCYFKQIPACAHRTVVFRSQSETELLRREADVSDQMLSHPTAAYTGNVLVQSDTVQTD